MTEDSRYIEKIPNRSMTHTDTDIAEILERFRDRFFTYLFEGDTREELEDFITRECLALKKKWEREHSDDQEI